jgi:hypothetical protein
LVVVVVVAASRLTSSSCGIAVEAYNRRVAELRQGAGP